MFYTYVIVSEIKGLRFYVGLTDDVEARLKQHNNGHSQSTKGYTPWQLFFKETYTMVSTQKKPNYNWWDLTSQKLLRIYRSS